MDPDAVEESRMRKTPWPERTLNTHGPRGFVISRDLVQAPPQSRLTQKPAHPAILTAQAECQRVRLSPRYVQAGSAQPYLGRPCTPSRFQVGPQRTCARILGLPIEPQICDRQVVYDSTHGITPQCLRAHIPNADFWLHHP